VSTDVSEEHIASIFRVEEVISARNHLLACWFLAEIIASTLKMEAICSSETSVDTQWTTQRYIPKVNTLYYHCCENLKLYKLLGSSIFSRIDP
jgi:hypothetical protein